MHESDLLRHIESVSADLAGFAGAFGRVLVGPGDDCAVVQTTGGEVLLATVDQLVEGRHFTPDTPIDLIARKAVARSVSDIAAMGGSPAWGLATGLLPDGFAHGRALIDALHAWARHWGCPLIGGDLATGTGPMCLTVTIIGRMEPGTPPMLRSGARARDLLYLTGPIGASFTSNWHLHFEPRIEIGRVAAASGHVHAAIDVSDGLGRDAGRMARASSVRLEIDASAIPLRDASRPWKSAASDGEDYELLLSLAPEHQSFAATLGLLGPIGRVSGALTPADIGAFELDNGSAHAVDGLGWDHGATIAPP
jgi:thiamine-monophosphate kinase